MNLDTIKATWAAFQEDKALRLASAIAYSTIFSIVPLFIVLIAAVGWAIGLQNGGHGHHVARSALLDAISGSAGKDAAETVRDMLDASFQKPRQNLFAQFAAWAAFLAGASALFASLQDALNSIWHVEEVKGGWMHAVRERLVSFGMLAVVGFLLLVTLIGGVAATSFGNRLVAFIPFLKSEFIVAAVSQCLTALVIMAVFSAMYRFLPNVKLGWRDVLRGAFATTLLFIVGESLVAYYLRTAGVSSSFGKAGSVLVALLWIYYTAAIFLLGAEYTKVRTGKVETTVPTTVRTLSDQPAGIDPRSV